MAAPQRERRALLEKMFTGLRSPLHLTPMTHDSGLAKQWLEQFEGAGPDGVIAKPPGRAHQPGQRALIKIKHARTAECVVAGFRWHKTRHDAVGAPLLGLYDHEGPLPHGRV